MPYTVHEVSKKTGISTYTIRYYAKEGLFPNLGRNENGVRLFKVDDLHWLYLIEHFKRAGMTIKEIKQFIEWHTKGNESIKERKEFFTQKRLQVEEKIELLKKTLDFVTYKEWEYTKAHEAGTTDVINSMDEDQMPEELKAIRDVVNREREYSGIK